VAQAQTVVTVNVAANRHAISPLIYGAAFPDAGQIADLNFVVSRYGGNEASSYNWLENCQAKGNDWYYETWPSDSSGVAGGTVDSFVSLVQTDGGSPILTMPMLNYVGKLGAGGAVDWSYSVAKYGAQTATDPWNGDAGNGISSSTGDPIVNDVNDANTPNSVAMQQEWLGHLLSTWGASNAGGVKYYLMDNEPSIWHSTHMDVHPVGETYDELYADYLSYAGAIRSADPNALIGGPEEWGWLGYFYSGYDQQWLGAHGWSGTPPDMAGHNGMQHIPWLLQSLCQYQKSTGIQLLNILSVHYYPQQGEDGDDDSAAMQAIRNRSTRSLWDPNYTDTSWIDSVVRLIPRMKGWVSDYYPGLLTAITEYNWGDEGEMNGGTAQADVLGIFGREGLDMGSRWTTPATNSPAYLAMKIYRNYDGARSAFGDTSVSCSAPNPDDLAAFAAQRASDGALTVMLINKVTTAVTVQVNLSGFTPQGSAAGWQISPSSPNAIQALSSVSANGSGFTVTVPAQSVTIYVLPPTPGVAGQVTLQDYSGDVTQVPITVEIRKPGTTTVVQTATVYLHSDGTFSLPSGLTGTYDVAVKGSHWLSRKISSVALTGSTEVGGLNFSLVNGDVNGDNVINLADLMKIAAAWRSTPTSSNWNVNADVNGDGTVNLADWMVVAKNWRQTGNP
jgi:hypothetical protein